MLKCPGRVRTPEGSAVRTASGAGELPRSGVRRDHKKRGRQGRPRQPRSSIRPGSYSYWIGVPPPPGAICASVVGVALFVKKIVPAALVAKLRLPVVPWVTGIDVP